MLSQKQFNREITSLVETRIAEQAPIATSWITHEIISRHDEISGPDADWHRLCAFGHVQASVRKIVRRYKPEPGHGADAQIILPGFDEVQVAYLVERDGESCLVPTDQLTDEEVLSKIAELERMKAGLDTDPRWHCGCGRHVGELRRYLSERLALRGAGGPA